MFTRFTINAIQLAAVCAIFETVLIFYVSDIGEDPKDSGIEEAELRQKFHEEYLWSIFENNDEDPEDPSIKVADK